MKRYLKALLLLLAGGCLLCALLSRQMPVTAGDLTVRKSGSLMTRAKVSST